MSELQAGNATATKLDAFPTKTRSYLFHEGAFVIGDGGMYDVGIVRDGDLVNSNDFRVFSESFEGVFDRGQWAYVLDADVCPSGTSSGAVNLQDGLPVASRAPIHPIIARLARISVVNALT